MVVVWLLCFETHRDPDNAGVDTAEAIRRMKQAQSRAKKGGGVKEVKTLKALQQELKVIYNFGHAARLFFTTPAA